MLLALGFDAHAVKELNEERWRSAYATARPDKPIRTPSFDTRARCIAIVADRARELAVAVQQ